METTIGLTEEQQPLVLAVAAFVFFVLGIVSALEAILKTRTAQGAVAWALLLVIFPPLMVPLYWIFGRRKFRGYVRARRKGNLEIQLLAADLNERFLRYTPTEHTVDPAVVALERLASMPFMVGNEVRLLINGHNAFDDIFAHIRRARRYVLLEFYIIRDDALGHELRDLLIAKAAEGVAIYFLYDEIGCLQLPRRFVRSLTSRGVNMHAFHSTKGLRNRLQLNFRNHRKIVVVDGEYGNVGGVNVGEEYIDRHRRLTPWRDTNIALRGPAVQAIQLAFAEDWFWATETLPALNWEPVAVTEANVETLVLPSGPADSLETCALYFLNLIHHAKKRLWIVSPYFVPDSAVISALQLAALRGVDVRILLPELADKILIKLSSYTYIRETIFCGVKFYRYRRGFLHQKVLLMDDEYASVSTANLDNRSFRLNFEISVFTRDAEFAREVEAMLEADFSQSHQLQTDEVRDWSLTRKLLSRCAYLLAPIQ